MEWATDILTIENRTERSGFVRRIWRAHDELYNGETVLLGRRTYDAFAAVWPQVNDEAGFAKRMMRCDILVYGSAMLLHTLMPAGLVDQYNLMIFPTVLGRGIRLFPQDWKGAVKLEGCTEFGSGIVMLKYMSA